MKLKSEEFKKLTPVKKVEFIWDYYKFPLIIGLVAVIGLISLTVSLINYKKVTLNCLVFNDMSNTSLEDALHDDFAVYTGDKKTNAQVDVMFQFYVDLDGKVYPEDSTSVKMTAMLNSGQADVIIGNLDSLWYFENLDIFLPIKDAISTELYSELSQYVVSIDDNADALDISGTAFYKAHTGAYKDALLCVPATVTNKAELEQFIRFIYGI